jgi:hypothetical protein
MKRPTKRAKQSPDWRQFELLVATIEELLAPNGAVVKSPDRLRDIDTRRLRQVDASIRYSVGSVELLLTIECRRRSRNADVRWIEELATKRIKIGAAKTIAISPKGFSPEARQCASRYGIELRVLGEITPSDIAAWFVPETFIHSFRLISDVRCEIHLVTGQIEIVNAQSPKFRHPEVNGDFPACNFFNFMEMKNPAVFGPIRNDELKREIKFELNGNDPELIPVPLGEQRRFGPLEFKTGDEYVSVRRLTLTAVMQYFSEELAPEKGRHFLYGSPEKPNALFSNYTTKLFGVLAQIDRISTETDKGGAATISFPSGLTLPGKLTGTRIRNVSRLDVKEINLCPISLKLRGRPEIKARVIEPEVLQKLCPIGKFGIDQIAFIEERDWRILIEGALTNPSGIMPSDFFKSVLKTDIEYIDLAPAVERPRPPQSDAIET